MKKLSSDTFKYYFKLKTIILIQKSNFFMKNYSSDTFKYYFSKKNIILKLKSNFFHEKAFF
jgi:hypothetical protein